MYPLRTLLEMNSSWLSARLSIFTGWYHFRTASGTASAAMALSFFLLPVISEQVHDTTKHKHLE
jgi:hypothetical protein